MFDLRTVVIAASFILAVMLERKRLLKVQEQILREGRRIFVYEHSKTGDLFTIPDPALQLDQLDQVQAQVAQLMEHGLEGAPAPPPVPVDGGQVANTEAPAAASEQAEATSQEENNPAPPP